MFYPKKVELRNNPQKRCHMKKFVLVGMFVLAAAGFAFATSHDPDDTLLIDAKILPVFDVVATPSENPLVLVEAGISTPATAAVVGGVTVNTNSRNWKISVSSSNEGKLVATDGATSYSIPYGLVLTGVSGATNWAEGDIVLSTGIAGAAADWTTLATATAFTKRTTPSATDALVAGIIYDSAAANAANWQSLTTTGADLVYQDTVTITASVM